MVTRKYGFRLLHSVLWLALGVLPKPELSEITPSYTHSLFTIQTVYAEFHSTHHHEIAITRVFPRCSEGWVWGGSKEILSFGFFFYILFNHYPNHICERKVATLIVLTVKSLFLSPNNMFEI